MNILEDYKILQVISMHDNSSKSKIGKNEYCGTSWYIMIHQNPKLADIDHIHYAP